ncbi:hypothetical protein [Actinokineospora sp. HUAS TT18]|uniref:hypothetical protein n=1 Tax=Actinokineospora sp. HUAS TT18 TaxID=3447451 RepID=UPI003F51EEF4
MTFYAGPDARYARELEARADREPERRGEFLVEAGEHWHRAGDTNRAIALLMEAAELGGEDGGYARVALAGMFVDLGWTAEADGQLAALCREMPPNPGAFELAAELVQERGDLPGAVRMYDLAISLVEDDELAFAQDPDEPPTYVRMLINARRRVRKLMGLPPDELDSSIPDPLWD